MTRCRDGGDGPTWRPSAPTYCGAPRSLVDTKRNQAQEQRATRVNMFGMRAWRQTRRSIAESGAAMSACAQEGKSGLSLPLVLPLMNGHGCKRVV